MSAIAKPDDSALPRNEQEDSNGEIQDIHKQGFDLGMLVGDLALDDGASRVNPPAIIGEEEGSGRLGESDPADPDSGRVGSVEPADSNGVWPTLGRPDDDISLDGLQKELEECKKDEEISNILAKGTKLKESTKNVETNVRQVELASIQDYIKESDNLVLLHDQIRDCDNILSQMETLLSGFQVAESKLAKFVEDIIVPPRMVDVIVDGEVNEEYMRTLETLSKKLKFVDVDPMVKSSKALKDVQPELERLRQKAVSKVFEFIVQKLYALRKPKTNIQILQQSVLLKYKYVILFLKEHGKEIYNEVRAAYIDTMNKT
ncbi:hypothetical protein Taro_020591 [Colocasia esculenta]|uniref:Vps52 coiled-coil domain-containing protein n=1 Tax=Colocasia esculenta TaxID=4460 RepID=A0A843V021_COLES|nr:hypothetical protein [Colocasia esculenta]